MSQPLASFWSASADQVFKQLQTSQQGLTSDEAQQRLKRYGANLLKAKKQATMCEQCSREITGYGTNTGNSTA